MDWFIKQALACPNTGTTFAKASCMRNLKLILWYRGDYFLRQGNTLSTSPFGLIVNGKRRDLIIAHAFPFSPSLWNSLINNMDCPGNTDQFIAECPKRPKCMFKHCPYGVKTKQ